MELLFVDESGDYKFNEYFGLCVAAINASHYKAAKVGFQDILRSTGWDETIEFKGSYLFSASKGDLGIPIEQRIEMAKAIIDLNAAAKNARMRFHYFSRHDCSSVHDEYLSVLPELVKRALPKAKKARAKDLVAVSCDYRNDIRATEIQEAVLPAVEVKGYTLLEEVTTPTSSFHTVGILYADLISYLAARIETIGNDSELFEGITPELLEQSGKVKKLQSSTELIERVKSMVTYVST